MSPINLMSGRDGLCRHRVGTMSKLVGMLRAMAMLMSKRDVIKKLMSSGLDIDLKSIKNSIKR